MGSMADLNSSLKVVNFLTPQTINDSGGDVEVTDIDLQGYRGALIAISAAVSGDAAPVFKIKVEHSDDGTAYSAVTADDLLGVEAVTAGVIGDADKVFDDGTAGHDIGSGDGTAHTAAFGYIGGKRYLQITVDEDGVNATGTAFSGVLIKGHPQVAPVEYAD